MILSFYSLTESKRFYRDKTLQKAVPLRYAILCSDAEYMDRSAYVWFIIATNKLFFEIYKWHSESNFSG